MTSAELDQKYTSAGSTHEEYRKWITRVSDETDDATVLRNILSTMGQMESVLMGVYAELVYARHTTQVVAAVPAKATGASTKKQNSLSELQKKKRRS